MVIGFFFFVSGSVDPFSRQRMNVVKEIQRINQKELEKGYDDRTSWCVNVCWEWGICVCERWNSACVRVCVCECLNL
jgi:hypothetical protein